MRAATAAPRGFGLVELVIAMALVSVTVAGAVRIAQATASGFRLQKNLATLQENGRYALATLGREILSAGYQPDPWNPDNMLDAISGASADAVTSASDRLGLRRWSDQNCLGNLNPVLNADGRPAFYLKESEFVLSGSGNLAMTCRYGPHSAQLTTQVNKLGLVTGAQAFQLLIAEDSNGDGSADRWVKVGQWHAERNVMAVQLALLLSSPEAVGAPPIEAVQVLDQIINPESDGHLHRVYRAIFQLQGRKR